jgi:hypothetical protein
MSTKTPFLLVSNCQVQPLKHGLSEVCKAVEIDTFPVHVVPLDQREATVNQYVKDKAKYKFVVSIPLSDDFGAMSIDRIRASFHPIPVIFITNIVFMGLHPDISYVGGISARAPGPIGDYHSKVALLAFLMGLSVSDAVKMYCDEIYRYIGYYNVFADSALELQSRDTNVTIPLGGVLEDAVRSGVAFLSHNHPTSVLLAPYINKIATWLAEHGHVELTGLQLRPEEMINFLACSSVFPIYPEVARYHDLPYPGSYVFRTATLGDSPSVPLDLDAFVAAEFDAFRNADRDFLVQNYPGNSLMCNFGDKAEFQQVVRDLINA